MEQRKFGIVNFFMSRHLALCCLIFLSCLVSSCSKDDGGEDPRPPLPALYAVVVAEGETVDKLNAADALFTIDDITSYGEDSGYLLLSKQLSDSDRRWYPLPVQYHIRFYAGDEFLFEALMNTTDNENILVFGFNLYFMASNENGTFLAFVYNYLTGEFDDSAFAQGVKRFCQILNGAGKLKPTAHKVDFEEGGISYLITDKDQCEVDVTYGENRYRGDITIPSKVNHEGREYTVTAIGERAFECCTGLGRLILPKTLRTIRKAAFHESSLSYIELPEGLDTIGVGGFIGCTKLTGLTVPQTVTVIDKSAFNSCTNLSSISLPAGLKELGARAFVLCKALRYVNLPVGLTVIEEETFSLCEELTEVIIPDSVETISTSAFYSCRKLEKVRTPISLKHIENSAFNDCVKLDRIDFPEGLETIGEMAFRSCPLDSIVLPASLREIGRRAFGCYYIQPTGKMNLMISHIQEPFPIEDLFESRWSWEAELRVPKGTKEKYQALEYWNSFSRITEME